MGRITHLLTVLLLCVLPALCQHVRHPQHYCRLSQEHQLCNRRPPSSSCGRLLWRGTTLQQRKHVLEMHNVIRSQVARGNVQGFDGFLPPAADMIELTDIFCNYGGVGNVVDHPVYQRGPPCSRCPPGTHCSPVFPGLCAPNKA
ncbi:CRISP-1 [Amphibalanus amphitrite]|uniref:CRISP-1 n=1 Tax=Amphibalanus amphitrite TaxID=1232801 RepID=A0A6A4WVX0_AMPAM|nr:CRISP-1 [Amphibalanus amphitrite]